MSTDQPQRTRGQQNDLPTVVVAGHLCLDVIPTFPPQYQGQPAPLIPGHLLQVGEAQFATGGAVANTGLALHRFGIPARLIGMIGNDLFGSSILQILRSHDESLAAHVKTSPHVASSYTIVISPPGIERSFLYFPGANDEFDTTHISLDDLENATLLHFGYPPLMRRMQTDAGSNLQAIFRIGRDAGLITSLDLAHVDPDSAAGTVDWEALLEHVLPYVDIVAPNLDEVMTMLAPAQSGRAVKTHSFRHSASSEQLMVVADRLLAMGAAIVLLKLGDNGIYFRSAPLSPCGPLATLGLSEAWWGREIFVPAFVVNVRGTTGAGDCAVGGFLAAMLRRYLPTEAITIAAAAGACNVERQDAISGVPNWQTLLTRLQNTWTRRPHSLSLPGWTFDPNNQVWSSPRDRLL